MQLPVYLDYNATTPLDPKVVQAMSQCLTEHLGNPSSKHIYGQRARAHIDQARQRLSELLGCLAHELIFTSGATEANNIAICGVANALQAKGRHIITSAIEHPAVAQPMQKLKAQGWEVTPLSVDEYGMVNPNDLVSAIRNDTVLISIMHANNEVGTIQPIVELASIAHSRGVYFHTDASQTVGKLNIQLAHSAIDLLTVAGHKFYASPGVGALFIRDGTVVEPVLVGAGHERGLRPGTENIAAIAGLGVAAQIAKEQMDNEVIHGCAMRNQLHELLANGIPDIILNGHPQARLSTTLNVSFPDIIGNQLLQQCEGHVAASVGAACHKHGGGVLRALGLERERIMAAVRFSVGRFTTKQEIEFAAMHLISGWHELAKRK